MQGLHNHYCRIITFFTIYLLFLYTASDNLCSLKVPIKSMDEIMKMRKDELFNYLEEYDGLVKPTDSIEVVQFEHGVKILYYHRNQKKPYKTQVYLNKIDDMDSLKK